MNLFSGSKGRRFLMLSVVVFSTLVLINFLVTVAQEPSTPVQYFPKVRADASVYRSPDSFRADSPPFGVLSCLKEAHLDDLDWWGKQRFEGLTYYYLAGHSNGDVYPLVVSSSDNMSCDLLVYDVAGHGLALADFIPLPVARSLWRQRYSLFIADQSKDQLQKLVKARNAGVDVQWSEEKKLALQDLEINVNAK